MKYANPQNLKDKAARRFARFLRDSKGSITQIMAVTALPAILVTGAAVDMVRLNSDKASFDVAVDGAALAVAADDRSAVGSLTDAQKLQRIAELEAYAKTYITTNYKPTSGTQGAITAGLVIDDQQVKLSATASVPTTLMSLAGINAVDLNSSSIIKKAMRPVELTMVMDTTGSMVNGGDFMSQAKVAAKKLVTNLYAGKTLAAAPESEFVRLSLVPFSAAVRLDTSAYDFDLSWIDTTGANPLSKLNFDHASAPAVWNNYYAWSKLKKSSSSYHTWNGCVESRAYAADYASYYAINDVGPDAANPATLFPAYFHPDTPSFDSGYTSGYSSYNYSSSYRNKSWAGNYINEDSSTPNEVTGLTAAQMADYSTSGLLRRQDNYRKYDGENIGAEPATGSAYGPWMDCAKSKIVPMTYSRSKIEAGIDAMTASGATNIPEGLAWGERTLSPGAPFTKVEGSGTLPAATLSNYGDARWRKVLVLMTDGENDLLSNGNELDSLNGAWYSSRGRSKEALGSNRFGTTDSYALEDRLNQDMVTICDKLKANGVTIYTTSFRVNSTDVVNRLKACASGPDYYAHSSTGADLQAFFDHIGKDVLNKSIYVSK